MSAWKWSKALAILTLLGLSLTAALSEAAAEEGHTLRIGLVSSLFRDTSETLMQIAMRPFKSLLEAHTNRSGRIVPGGGPAQLGQRLKDGDVHLGIFHGVEFAWAKAKYPKLKPLLLAVNNHLTLHAHLVVRADNKVKSLDDLKGRIIGMPALSREHCWLFLERRCVPAAQSPQKFYSTVSRPRDACYAIDDVIDGNLQAAVIDEGDLATYHKQYPQYAGKVKSLIRSEAFPAAVIAYHPGMLDERLVDQLRSSLLTAKDSRQGRQMMQLCRITSFEPAPEEFDKMLETIARAYPPPTK